MDDPSSRSMNRLTPILEQKQREVAKLLPRMEHLRMAALRRNDSVDSASHWIADRMRSGSLPR
jgi:hypothetical protein